MRVVIIGATGRTGSEIVAEASSPGHTAAGAATSSDTAEDIRVYPNETLPDLLDDADTAIDFTVPGASRQYAEAVAAPGVPYVAAPTGFDDAGMATLRAAS